MSNLPPRDAAAPAARLTVAGQVSFQREGQAPEPSQSLRFAHHPRTGEQPCRRECQVGEEWRPLDAGWFADAPAGLLLLSNPGPPAPERVPSREEQEAAAAAVVEVGLLTPRPPEKGRTMWSGPPAPSEPAPFALLRPRGAPLLLEPRNLGDYRLRCLAGLARVVACLYPA
jgi:hypothetical protein